ncbi:hypothetical protein [Bartonella sp. CB60]|uniref:hypothetical protein n=1 Tax=Bartonella sp. CB60 TaxID=3113619 RepID=UPI00300E23E9
MAFKEEYFFTFCYMTIDSNYRQIGLGKAFVTSHNTEVRKRELGCIKIVLREVLTENDLVFNQLGIYPNNIL